MKVVKFKTILPVRLGLSLSSRNTARYKLTLPFLIAPLGTVKDIPNKTMHTK